VGAAFSLVLVDANLQDMEDFTLAKAIKQDSELAETRIVLITSSGHAGDAARCRELGISAYLVKPVDQTTLRRAVSACFENSSSGEDSSSLVTRHSLRERRVSLRILLAEDNTMNQILAERIIRKHGHAVSVVNNGREAVAAFEKNEFDLILMDIQMPEMSGLEATAAIRQKEKATGTHIPIIAMTAFAMKEDKERCLAGGMDAYISKPIERAVLFETMERLTGVAGEDNVVRSEEQDKGPVFDDKAVMEYVGGDVELLEKIVAIFLSEYPDRLGDIRKAIVDQDAKKLEFAAHSLKGSLANLFAQRSAEQAGKLEQMGRESSFAGAEGACAALEKELVKFLQALIKLDREVARSDR
jgi:CheY-like chemotaxis protein